MRNRTWWSIAAMLLVSAPVAAQEPPPPPPAPRAEAVARRAVVSSRSGELAVVERALRLREPLALSADQLSRLESMRREALARWLESALEQEELHSRLRAGYEEEDARERLRALAEARRADAEETREQLDALLTEQQREQLNRRGRAVVAPRSPRAAPAPRRGEIRAPRALPSPDARATPRAPRPPRLEVAPRPPRPTPAPRPPRVRRWME